MDPSSHFPPGLAASIIAVGLLVPGLFAAAVLRGSANLGDCPKGRRFRVIFSAVFGTWLIAGLAVVASGGLSYTPNGFPRFLIAVGSSIIPGAVLLVRSETWRTVISKTPMEWLLSVQLARMLGFVFVIAGQAGALPREFAIPTGIGDMIAGASALVAILVWRAELAYRGGTVIISTLIGLGDAGNALRHALAAYPQSPQFGQLPFGLLFASAVPLLLLAHLFAVWKLFSPYSYWNGEQLPPEQDRSLVCTGDRIPPFRAETVNGETVTNVDLLGRASLLSFQRYAACPVCNFVMREYANRYAEIAKKGPRLAVVFHSPKERLHRHLSGLPFPVIADPEMKLYRRFGVGSRGFRGGLDPRTVLAALRALGHGTADPAAADGSATIVPSDFFFDADGIVRYVRHGSFVGDSLTVDQILSLNDKYLERPE